ncbi:hypothetical protein [Pseudomonas corrugata]|uniref:hypothetical protein n=1 Tax=Pseudomonas corrugata TaxID=47879 RepID=UPI00158623F6|nr:hypothetical protein [Pseudomonas corrugata]MCI0992533.1 hypothetical protein [Pseudomonas corrugata]NUT67274.1 hypothetical protein [Pseudomonas corrugata]
MNSFIMALYDLLGFLGGCILFFLLFDKLIMRTQKRSASFFKEITVISASRRYLFRLHRFNLIKALTLSLTMYFFSQLTLRLFEVIFDITLNFPLYFLPGLYIGCAILFLPMKGQGLTAALDKRLSLSWDRDDSLALHIRQRKVHSLSPAFTNSLAMAAATHLLDLRACNIGNPVRLDSWLFAPSLSRVNPELRKFQKILNLRNLKKFSPSLKARHTLWLMERAITRHKSSRRWPNKNSRRTLKIFWFLRCVVFLQKFVTTATSFILLMLRWRSIARSLQSLPKPNFSATYPMQNGTPSTQRIRGAELVFNAHIPTCRISLLPLERMSVFTVITLVAHNPRVSSQLGGWTTGIRVE